MKDYYMTGVIASILVCSVRCGDFTIPEGFFLGAGTAACQVEGAWNLSGKSESAFDHWVHSNQSNIADGNNADVARDSYHKYKEDVQLVKELGMDVYRFSIAWTRILPGGVDNMINQEGLQYYKNLINELLDNDIQPLVTIYHWDHPQILEDMGGWTNELMVDWFVDYARVIFEELGPMVKIFTTINELAMPALIGYDANNLQPGKTLGLLGKYLVTHNLLKAHAKAYHLYDKEYRPTQKGIIGVGITGYNGCPLNSNNASDMKAAEITFQFDYGMVMHPIWIGDYPEMIKRLLAQVSKARGYSKSCLPEFSPEWIEYIKGSADYAGVSLYGFAERTYNPSPDASSLNFGVVDRSYVAVANLAGPVRELLRRIRREYNNPQVIVLENGYSLGNDTHDYTRIEMFNTTMRGVLEAIKLDKCNIIGYCVWALFDTFEWTGGYLHRTGLYSVNITNPNRTTTPRLSAKWWKKVIETRDLDAVHLEDIISMEPTPVSKAPIESIKSHSIRLSPSILTILSGIYFTVAGKARVMCSIF